MTVKEEYLLYKDAQNLKTSIFEDRVKLQTFLRSKLEQIWSEKPSFSNGGLYSNKMTEYALGFAYYDCRPSKFCRKYCYGLPLSGINDYYMLRLAVITSEALKFEDDRYLNVLRRKLDELRYLKIGHWGDAVREQVPVIGKLAREYKRITFWWYTRKMEIAIDANILGLPNLKAYLSLDPETYYPSAHEYPFGITYLFGKDHSHKSHTQILEDKRLVAVFPLKRGHEIDNPNELGIGNHSKICLEKQEYSLSKIKGFRSCLDCDSRCNYNPN